MASTTDRTESPDPNPGGSSGGSMDIMGFLSEPLGMALVGGFALALVAGYLIL